MANKDQLILTAAGPDRVGLVEKIAELISRQGCNIEDSKMAAFCGEFAIIVLITGEADGLDKIAAGYREIEVATGLSIAIKKPREKMQTPAVSYRLTASCMDHPGIVHQISGILSALGVNIDSMETETYSAPVSGTPLFQLKAEISVPPGADMNRLLERFAEIQRQENIDIDLILES